MSPDDPRHGSEAGYTAHARAGQQSCEPCRRARARKNKWRQLTSAPPRKVPAIGTRRRIQALQSIGWSRDRIAAEAGYGDGASITYAFRSDTIRAVTAERIAAAYDRLSMVVPTGAGPSRARTWARRHGYPPPLAWDDIDDPDEQPQAIVRGPADNHERQALVDHAVIERVVAGEPRPRRLTNAESVEIVRRLLARGHSTSEVENVWGFKSERYKGDTA